MNKENKKTFNDALKMVDSLLELKNKYIEMISPKLTLSETLLANEVLSGFLLSIQGTETQEEDPTTKINEINSRMEALENSMHDVPDEIPNIDEREIKEIKSHIPDEEEIGEDDDLDDNNLQIEDDDEFDKPEIDRIPLPEKIEIENKKAEEEKKRIPLTERIRMMREQKAKKPNVHN